MDIQGLEMVIIFVTDVEKSIQWYQDVLDMTLLSHHGDFATLQAGSGRIGLHGGANPEPDLHNAGTMPVFAVKDYAEAKETLDSRGCDFVFENSTPAARFGTFLDPDGNPLQIMQHVSTVNEWSSSLDFGDLDTYLLLLDVAKKHAVDPSSSLESEAFFTDLLKKYPGSFDDEVELVEWLDEQIQEHFISLDKRPEWIQEPEWAFADGKPMVFAGQIDISIRDLPRPYFHDDTSLYVFVGTKVAPVIVMQQY